jgi:hypothetical protein
MRGPFARPNVLPGSVEDVVAGRADVVIDLDPGLVVAGTVFLADGAPAPGGSVYCRRQHAQGGQQGDAESGNAPIAGGKFEVAGLVAGTYDVTVAAEGHAPKKLALDAGAAPVRVDLTLGGMLRGRALLPDGSPAKGVRVSASGTSGNGSAQAGDDGRYEIRGLAEGTYSIQAFVFESGKVYRGNAEPIAVNDGQTTDVPDVTCEEQASRAPVAPPPKPPAPPRPR